MTCLVLGAGLVGSQIARILVERGERPVPRASSLRRAKEVLGYAPRYSMREAVRDLAAWLKRQPLPTP